MALKVAVLHIAAVVVAVVYGIPIAFAPLRWARAVGWTVPDDTRLVRYFGRCLGVLILSLVGFVVYAARRPPLVPVALILSAAAFLAMVVVHVVGALERAQPPFESWEIVLFLPCGLFLGWLGLQ
jgi:hypothetical protein